MTGPPRSRGVGDDEIVRVGLIPLNGALYDGDPPRPGGGGRVLAGLLRRMLIQLHRIDAAIGVAALGQHQGDEAAAGANVEDPAGLAERCPGAQQNAVGAHLHGAAIVLDVKLFEGKTAVSCHPTPVLYPPRRKWSAIIAAKAQSP